MLLTQAPKFVGIYKSDSDGKFAGGRLIAYRNEGDMTYTLMIELEPTDPSLRQGMNARVEILTE